MKDCPNNNADIGFIAQVPYHFYVFKNIIKHLSDAEFIVGEPYSYDEPPEIQSKRLGGLIDLIEKEKIPWRFFDFEKDRNPRNNFFEKYNILVATTANGIITSPLIKSIKKVRVQYGQSKDAFEFGDWNRYFDLILAQGPYSAQHFRALTQCVEIGFPKFDDWFNGKIDGADAGELKSKMDPRKKTLLYLPTHGALSSLEKYREIFSALRNKYNILVKFHPRTVWHDSGQVLFYKNNGFATYDDSADILPMLKIADIVISDSGGAAFDALLAEKSLVILDVPIAAEETGELQTQENSIEQVIKRERKRIGPVVDSPDKLESALEIAEQEFFEERRREWRGKLFSFVDGKDGERAAREILRFKNRGPNYSVIIPTFNRCQSLIKALNSTINQTIPASNYEILVVDDGSADDTSEVVSEFQKKHPNVKYFYQQNGGPAKARNKGIKESKGEIIFFTDDDCVVPPNWMETLLDGFERYPGVAGVGGWYQPANKSLADKYFQRYLDYFDRQNNIGMMDTEIKSNIFGYNLAGNTANMAYKKSVLEEVSGFDEKLYFVGGVDWELKKNIQNRGYYLLYVPFMVNHFKNFNARTFIKKFFNRGRGYHYMIKKHPDLRNSSYYNVNLINLLEQTVNYALNGNKFLPLHFHFLALLCVFCGRFYAKYINQFSNIPKILLNASDNFEIVKKKTGEERIFTTKIRPFKCCDTNTRIHTNNTNNTNKIKYSIIIPTFNRCQSLIKALNSTINQTIPAFNYEIIVIDDDSTDDTKSQISRLRQGFGGQAKPEIRYFKIEHGGPAKARNKGIKESKGEIIFFTDDDCVVPPNWMETLLDGYKRYPNIVGVGGWLIEPKETLRKSYLARYIHYIHFCIDYFPAWTLFNCEILSNDPERGLGNFAGNTANLSIKRDILEQMSGFREDYYWPGSEDSDLSFRILNAGLKLLYVPFHVEHIKNIDLWGLMKLFFKRGANFYLFLKFNKEALDKINAGNPENYDTFPILIRRLIYRTYKFLTLSQFVSHKLGMVYMKNKLGE